jgi:uridine kinase
VSIERPHPVRVAIDGISASGKTSLGDELAGLIEARGRPAIRASLDNFKRPWSERHLYDRESGEGYYRNAYDYDLIRTVLLQPLGPAGNRVYQSASIDPLTQRNVTETLLAPSDAVLLADGVFLLRPELDGLWEYRVFLDIDFDTALRRWAARDQGWAGSWDAAAALYRTRYIPSEQIYLDEVNPRAHVDLILDQRDFDNPRIVSE